VDCRSELNIQVIIDSIDSVDNIGSIGSVDSSGDTCETVGFYIIECWYGG
jgi:hypothetical protein